MSGLRGHFFGHCFFTGLWGPTFPVVLERCQKDENASPKIRNISVYSRFNNCQRNSRYSNSNEVRHFRIMRTGRGKVGQRRNKACPSTKVGNEDLPCLLGHYPYTQTQLWQNPGIWGPHWFNWTFYLLLWCRWKGIIFLSDQVSWNNPELLIDTVIIYLNSCVENKLHD